MAIKAGRPAKTKGVEESKVQAFIGGAVAEKPQAAVKYADKYIRATWYVEKAQIKALKQIALDTERDTSDLVREAINMVIEKHRSK